MVPPANQGLSSLANTLPARDERPDAGRIAEHLVERERDEVRFDRTEVETVRGHEGRAIQQHVPTPVVGRLDPLQRVLDAAEVGLRRVGEQTSLARTPVRPVLAREGPRPGATPGSSPERR